MNGIIVAKCVKDTSPNRNKGEAVRDWALDRVENSPAEGR